MRSFLLALVGSALLAPFPPAAAADLTKVGRTIGKEPKYAGAPRYCLFVFGAEAKDRVWLVQDGNTLYVDRNGNGDLTDPEDKVTAPKPQPGDPEGAYAFDVGELAVGGKTHKGLKVRLSPVKSFADNPNLMAMSSIAEAVKTHPDATTAGIDLDVECANLRGGGIGGRVSYMLVLFDTQGVLRFADKAADAPVVHFDGPLQISFYGPLPTWRGGRSQDAVLCVGTPGVGPGTFAMVKYEGTVPPGKYPKATVTYTPNAGGGSRRRRRSSSRSGVDM